MVKKDRGGKKDKIRNKERSNMLMPVRFYSCSLGFDDIFGGNFLKGLNPD